MTEDPRKSFSVGFVVFVATLLVIVGLFSVGGPGILDRTVSYRIVVDSANNVRKGSKVYLDGVVVGQVRSVEFQPVEEEALEPRNVEIRLAIAQQNILRIREGTVAWLASEGLLGDQVVQLKTGDWELRPLPAGSEIQFYPRSLVEDLIGEETQANAERLLQELVRLLKDVQEGKGTLGKFLTDDELYANATELVGQAERTLREIADILEGMRDGETPLAEVLLGPEDAMALSIALESAAAVLGKLEPVESLAAALGPDFVSSLESIASILDKVERGEGTLGRFINDPTIADNLSNVFLGVREEPLVRNLIRNAETSGRQIYSEAAHRGDQEARIRAAIAERTRGSGVPVGASGPGAADDSAPPPLDLPSGGGGGN